MIARAVAIFAVTYALISARRLQLFGLDRPAVALLGAVACVALGVLEPGEALASIDGATLLLLFGVMGMGAFLAVDGFFDALEDRLVVVARTPARLLALVVWGSGLLSALITNDAVCLLGAPLVVRLIERHKLPALPLVLGLATGANTGSVATLVGNPQNMLCGELGRLAFLPFARLMMPVAVVGLALNHVVVWWKFRHELAAARLTLPTTSRALSTHAKITLAVIAITSAAYATGLHLAWTATAGFVVLLLTHRRDAREMWPRIDWALLLFFSGLFVVVAGLTKSGAPAAFFARFPLAQSDASLGAWARLSAIFFFGSNVVTNVPFILVVRDQVASLPNARLGWELLAMASTFAGNLTLVGSVANVIVAEAARPVGGFGFREHLRVGLPVGLATALFGTAWVVVMGA